jgi:hypothetical protein
VKNPSRGRIPPLTCLMLLLLQIGCASTPAPKVQCDSNLRPINSKQTVTP